MKRKMLLKKVMLTFVVDLEDEIYIGILRISQYRDNVL